jgi:hypothetical protein
LRVWDALRSLTSIWCTRGERAWTKHRQLATTSGLAQLRVVCAARMLATKRQSAVSHVFCPRPRLSAGARVLEVRPLPPPRLSRLHRWTRHHQSAIPDIQHSSLIIIDAHRTFHTAEPEKRVGPRRLRSAGRQRAVQASDEQPPDVSTRNSHSSPSLPRLHLVHHHHCHHLHTRTGAQTLHLQSPDNTIIWTTGAACRGASPCRSHSSSCRRRGHRTSQHSSDALYPPSE